MKNSFINKLFPLDTIKRPAAIVLHTLFWIPRENEALEFLKLYLNFGFCFLFLPFRIRFNTSTKSYELKTNVLQRTLRILMASMSGLYYIMRVRQLYFDHPRTKLSVYFEIACYFFDTLFILFILAVLGQKGDEINEVFQTLQNANYTFVVVPSHKRKVSPKLITRMLCALCLGHVLIFAIKSCTNNGWNFGDTWKEFEENGCRILRFLNPCPTPSSILSKCLGIFSLISQIVDPLMNTYCDLMFVVTILLFRELVICFKYTLDNSEHMSTTQILDHYDWLKNATGKINRAMGIIVFSFVIGNLPFFATNLFDVFLENNNFSRAIHLFVCVYFFTTLFITAKYSKEVEEITHWLWQEKNYRHISPLQLTVRLQEVSTHTVALSAFGCVTINYGTVGSIVSVIFTYALLKLQFQTQPDF